MPSVDPTWPRQLAVFVFFVATILAFKEVAPSMARDTKNVLESHDNHNLIRAFDDGHWQANGFARLQGAPELGWLLTPKSILDGRRGETAGRFDHCPFLQRRDCRAQIANLEFGSVALRPDQLNQDAGPGRRARRLSAEDSEQRLSQPVRRWLLQGRSTTAKPVFRGLRRPDRKLGWLGTCPRQHMGPFYWNRGQQSPEETHWLCMLCWWSRTLGVG
jgi:hypothetical protein